MDYDLYIIKLERPQSKQIVARHLATDPSISLQKALSLLEKPPVLFLKNIPENTMGEKIKQLNRLGIIYKAVPSKHHISNDQPKDATTLPSANQLKHDRVKKTDQSLRPDPELVKSKYVKKEKVKTISFSFEQKQNKQPRSMNQLKGWIIFLVVTVLLIWLLPYLMKKDNKYKIHSKSTAPTISQQKYQNNSNQYEPQTLTRSKKMHRKKNMVTPEQKKFSRVYSDSAKLVGDDYQRSINFYKIAISFNRHNLSAWQGLMTTYRAAKMWSEQTKTEKKMREIFGNDIFTVHHIIKPYGQLSEYNFDQDGTCRIAYQSRLKHRKQLEKETFLLIRALITHQTYKNISLYAATGKGRGMLVRIEGQNFPSTISAYQQKASILFSE